MCIVTSSTAEHWRAYQGPGVQLHAHRANACWAAQPSWGAQYTNLLQGADQGPFFVLGATSRRPLGSAAIMEHAMKPLQGLPGGILCA